MAKNIFVGVNGVARKPKAIYVGVNGVARRVKSVYVGVNGVARKVYPGGVVPNSYTQFAYIDGYCGHIYTDVNPLSYPRIVIDFSILSGQIKSGILFDALYDFNNHNPDTGEGLKDTWTVSYGASVPYNSPPFHFYFYGYGLDDDGYYQSDWPYDYNFDSNSSEGVLNDTRYKLDFFNGNGVYLYNSEGYYSIASHNLVNSISSKPSLTNKYGSPYTNYNNAIRMFGVGVVYGAKMYNGNTLIRDYYPCYRNSDHRMGYYDLVNKIFYSCRRGSPDNENYCTYEYALENNYLIGPIV